MGKFFLAFSSLIFFINGEIIMGGSVYRDNDFLRCNTSPWFVVKASWEGKTIKIEVIARNDEIIVELCTVLVPSKIVQ
jgi:hypothetical protein